MKLLQTENTLGVAAAKAGMDEKTARKYRDLGKAPSEVKAEHHWRTREDPFEDVWQDIKEQLDLNPQLEAKTLFEDLQRRHEGRFGAGQLRTLQRRIKQWRALEGPGKEVYFAQEYQPAERSQSDFTCMNGQCITINREPFKHLVYHFVLPYSGWETGTVCYNESFESLSQGLQNALWQVGGVPQMHQTDRLSAAVHNGCQPDEFTSAYQGLMRHYGMVARRTQAASPHENGAVEQSHHRFKRAVEQALLLRNSCDFGSRQEYEAFLEKLFKQLNQGRTERFEQELKGMSQLPSKRLESLRRIICRVTSGSVIRVLGNVYSVQSRLIGEEVEVRVELESLCVWYGQKLQEKIPRLSGKKQHYINYRHIIDWLIRKPGAFANYRYRQDLFPTHQFRVAYDQLRSRKPSRADRIYLQVLHLAAKWSQSQVDELLAQRIQRSESIDPDWIHRQLQQPDSLPQRQDVQISQLDLEAYDTLLSQREVA